MKRHSLLNNILIATLVCTLAACNFPTARSKATSTATLKPSATTLPTKTTAPLSPTATLGPIMPLDTPTLPQPKFTNTPIPTATRIPPTPAPLKLKAGVLFKGKFDGGALVFRIGDNGNWVIPKQVTVNTTCKGKKFNDTISFEPPPSFAITNLQFTITVGDQVTISGAFNSATSASGTIKLFIKSGKTSCSIGPEPWTASGS
jgi:hypothetical protein